MKFSISNRQPKELRALADEIKMEYRDIDILVDLMDENITKKLVIIVSQDDKVDYDKLAVYAKGLNITMAVSDLSMGREYNVRGIPFYWVYPITSYYELNSALEAGVSEVLLNAPLYFDLPQVKKIVSKYNAEVRLIANICYYNYLMRADGVCGTYVRPEDVSVYEPYVNTLEFIAETYSKEAVLFEVYAIKKTWPGNLNLLLTNFNCQVDNRSIADEFAAARIQCRQDCMRRGGCDFCNTIMKFGKALSAHKNDKR